MIIKKEELIRLLDKYGNNDFVRFFVPNSNCEGFYEIETIEEPLNADDIWINLKPEE